MERLCEEVVRIEGQTAKRIIAALKRGLPLEYEQEGNDCIILRVVTATKPECMEDFQPITPLY